MTDRMRLIALAVSAFGLSGGTASAGIVYEQPPQYPNMQSAWSSSFDRTNLSGMTNYGNIYTTYDEFSLTNAATLTNLTWQGFSFDRNTLGSTISLVSGFIISFYANSYDAASSSYVPGESLFCEKIGFTQQEPRPIDQFGNGQTETVYDYSGALPGGFAAAAGTTYWLSIQAVTDDPAIWMWTSGTGGNGTSYQVVSPEFGGGSYVRPGDRAFALLSVAEPPSLALCGIAVLIGLGAARLRATGRSASSATQSPCNPGRRGG